MILTCKDCEHYEKYKYGDYVMKCKLDDVLYKDLCICRKFDGKETCAAEKESVEND